MPESMKPIGIEALRVPYTVPDGTIYFLNARVLYIMMGGIIHAHDMETGQLGAGQNINEAKEELLENLVWFFEKCGKDPYNSAITPAPQELQNLWESIRLSTEKAHHSENFSSFLARHLDTAKTA